MNREKLEETLKLHRKWLKNEKDGVRADLSGADLRDADLRDADLRDADLRDTDLSDAVLHGADLSGADLRDADLRDTDLRGAVLENTKLPQFQICPQEGTFIAWKKVRSDVLLKLEVIGERTSSLIGRKCRSSKVKVLSAETIEGILIENETSFHSKHDQNFVYEIGKEISEPTYDSDIRLECTKGIHFFITRGEAVNY